MGNLEKLVVLTAVFGAAVVLAISFNRDQDPIEAANPLSGASELLGEGQTPRLEGALGLEGDLEGARTPLLNAGASLDESVPPTEAAPSHDAFEPSAMPGTGDFRILRESQGLRPSFMDDYMVYVVTEGDSWSSLAQRFFQDGRYTRNLMQANDNLEDLQPGTEILVPVFDLLARDAGLRAGASGMLADAPAATDVPAPVRSADADVGRPLVTEPAPLATPPAKAKGTLEYVVRSGDTLSDIAQSTLGSAARWKEILEANKDVLAKPEALQVGMKLKLPSGGKLPAVAKAADKEPKVAPKGAPAKADSTTKKKKVL